MSRNFRGVTFANQSVTPSDDAIFMRHTLTDGILTGCSLTYSDDILTMDAGYLIACGRLIHRPSAEDWAINGKTSGYARVVMTIDLTLAATVETFDQVNVSIEYADNVSEFPALTKEDINDAGSMYQTVLAMVSLGVGGITGIKSQIGTSCVGRVSYLPIVDGAGYHNSIYRGKNLGSVVTDEQWATIASGTFSDVYIGDYWCDGDLYYRVAAFDYYYMAGSVQCTDHHITIVPDIPMYDYQMNASNTTSGGYVGSKMRQEGRQDAINRINNFFGSAHILTVNQILCNAVSSGRPSGGAWYDTTVELMTEQQMFGGRVYGVANDGASIPYYNLMCKSQFPLFVFRPDLISNRRRFFLRDVVSDKFFASVHSAGIAYYDGASTVIGMRPTFSIKG